MAEEKIKSGIIQGIILGLLIFIFISNIIFGLDKQGVDING